MYQIVVLLFSEIYSQDFLTIPWQKMWAISVSAEISRVKVQFLLKQDI